ncbi:amino acid/polyamine transporter I [Peziza echinospora]|nr:amino acid/polyamine transporter I [Peziza echinospora]
MRETRKLGLLSTASLIINKMIGSGIFAKPSYVLENVGGSKGLALVMWTTGAVMTFAALIIYLEFGAAFPFNGAEIVYVDEAYKRPRYFAVIVVSIMFVMLGHNAANCIGFAKLILQAIDPTDINPDYRLQKFVAFVTLTTVCLIHVFSRKIGIMLNNVLAIYKLVLVGFICIAGLVALGGARSGKGEGILGAPDGRDHYGAENFDGAFDFIEQKQKLNLLNYAGAMMGVLYSYNGWENANYVLAEVKRPRGNPSLVFKRAAVGAFTAVAILYTMANVAYMAVLTSEEMTVAGDITAGKFFNKMFGQLSTRTINSLVCISIIGNIMSFTYGHARVKQEIAKLGILPFSSYWARQSPYGTPVGGITLHWLFAGTLILVVSGDDKSAGYDLTSNLFMYAQTVMVILVSIGVLLLRFHIGAPKEVDRSKPGFIPQIVSWPALFILIVLNTILNLGVLVFNWIPPPDNLLVDNIAWYVLPVVATGVITLGAVYWFFWAKFGEWVGWWQIDRVEVLLVDGGRDVRLLKETRGFAREAEDWWRTKILGKPLKRKDAMTRRIIIRNGVVIDHPGTG